MRDVRMRGFAERADIEDVDAFLRSHTAPLPAEDVELRVCAGRVLAEDVRAGVDVPAFPRASMDGYAVRGEDTFGASAYEPVSLSVLGETLPGRSFAGQVGKGDAVRVMTGAPLPAGADAVVMAEVCVEQGGRVEVSEAVAPRKHVGAVGEDIRCGELVLARGRRLRPQDAGLLASIGVARPRCVRRPRVDLVITGDELLPAGQPPERRAHRRQQLRRCSRALVARDGGALLPFELLPDRPERIRAALADSRRRRHRSCRAGARSARRTTPRACSPSSGASTSTASRCARRARPASGASEARFVFLLPGNPVSCLCAYEFFAGPTLRAPRRSARAPGHTAA